MGGKEEKGLQTQWWKIDTEKPQEQYIRRAAEIIREGGLVAFPTETVYGLGAHAFLPQALKRIFSAKGRPQDNPLILHVAAVEEVKDLAADIPLKAQVLMERFWPGPLTLILKKLPHIPAEVTAGLETVALRMPEHKTALALIKEAGVPLAAPSANRSGYPSPTMAEHVYADLNGRIEAILDSGPTGLGLESTILDVTQETPVILRPGGVTREEITETVGEVIAAESKSLESQEIPKAPGMKYKHYSPKAEVILIEGKVETILQAAAKISEGLRKEGKRVGLLFTEDVWRQAKEETPVSGDYQKSIGERENLASVAHNIYRELRQCDEYGLDVVLTETYISEGLGSALMDRLLKSAEHKVVKV